MCGWIDVVLKGTQMTESGDPHCAPAELPGFPALVPSEMLHFIFVAKQEVARLSKLVAESLPKHVWIEEHRGIEDAYLRSGARVPNLGDEVCIVAMAHAMADECVRLRAIAAKCDEKTKLAEEKHEVQK